LGTWELLGACRVDVALQEGSVLGANVVLPAPANLKLAVGTPLNMHGEIEAKAKRKA
jgi:hypothetical protein